MNDEQKSPTLDDLAELQNVKPVADVRALSGTWPGDVDDGFEEEIMAQRKRRCTWTQSDFGGVERLWQPTCQKTWFFEEELKNEMVFCPFCGGELLVEKEKK